MAFDDEAVADYFDAQVAAGRRPAQFARIWVHTHPGNSADPSGTDELTFARVFGSTDWAVMFILARGGQTFARLRCNVGPGADVAIAVEVDFQRPFESSNHQRWQEQYANCVEVNSSARHLTVPKREARPAAVESFHFDDWQDAWNEYAGFDLIPEDCPHGFIRDF